MSDAGHTKEIVIKGVSSLDEPSVKWGWHGFNRKFASAVGLFFAAFLLIMLIGNHVGHVEDIFLIVFAALIVIGIAIGFKKTPPRDAAKRHKYYTPPEMHYTNITSVAKAATAATVSNTAARTL